MQFAQYRPSRRAEVENICPRMDSDAQSADSAQARDYSVTYVCKRDYRYREKLGVRPCVNDVPGPG